MKVAYSELLEKNEKLKKENITLKVKYEDIKEMFDDLKKAYKEIGEVNVKLLNKLEEVRTLSKMIGERL